MKRPHRPAHLKPVRPRRKRRTDGQHASGSRNNLAFRWWRFTKVCCELYCELRDRLAIKAGWSQDPSLPKLPPSEPEEDEPRRRSAWPVIVFWAVLIASPFAVYHWYSPARRVVDKAYAAAARAVDREMNPPPKKSPESTYDSVTSSIETILPSENRGEAYAALLSWLRDRRPELSLKERLDEIDLIDGEITGEVRCMASPALSSGKDSEEGCGAPLTIRATCTAGDASNKWLILSLGNEEPDSRGCTFALQCSYSFYDYQLLTKHPGSKKTDEPPASGEPWLKAVDLDGDGSTEIIQTWRNTLHPEMSLQVYKWVAGEIGWKRILNVSNAYLGQVKIVNSDPASPPKLLIADGVAPESGEQNRELAEYLVSVYSWDRKRGTLRKTSQYMDKGEFDPEEVGGQRQIVPKLLPRSIRSLLDSHFKNGWLCFDEQAINGYRILTLFDAAKVTQADYAWVVVIDPAGKTRLASSGAIYGTSGVYKVLDMDGDGRLEAVLESNGGGAHGNMDYFVCGFYPKFRLLAGIQAGRGSILDIKDLNHDGKQEIIIADDCFDQFDGMPCGDTPFLLMVLRYRNGRYEEATRDFPHIARMELAEARTQLREYLLRDSVEPARDLGDSATDSLMIRWLANAAILGEQDVAYSEMMSILPIYSSHAWLSKNKNAIVATVRSSSRRVSYQSPDKIEE